MKILKWESCQRAKDLSDGTTQCWPLSSSEGRTEGASTTWQPHCPHLLRACRSDNNTGLVTGALHGKHLQLVMCVVLPNCQMSNIKGAQSPLLIWDYDLFLSTNLHFPKWTSITEIWQVGLLPDFTICFLWSGEIGKAFKFQNFHSFDTEC